MNESQVTVGFKVAASEKIRIEKTAEKLGLTTSEYLRSIINKDNEKLQRFTNYPENLIFNNQYLKVILKLIKALKEKTGIRNSPKIIIAALKLALENQNRMVSNKITNYLPKTK